MCGIAGFTIPAGLHPEEFYFSVDLRTLDLLLWARNHAVPVGEAAEVMQLRPDQVRSPEVPGERRGSAR
jgi:hypothetical protein